MSYQDEGNPVLEYDIHLTAKASEELDEYIAKLKAVQEPVEKKEEAKKEEPKEEGPKKEESKKEEPKKEEDDGPKSLLESMSKLNPSQITQVQKYLSVQGAAQAAGGEIFGALTSQEGGKLGKIGELLSKSAAFIAPIALAVGAAITTKMIIELLSRKGGPLNRDWKRFIHQEIDIGLSRRDVKERELGITQLILTQSSGWKPNNSAWTYNSLFEVNASRLARAGLEDRAAGVIDRTYG